MNYSKFCIFAFRKNGKFTIISDLNVVIINVNNCKL